MRSTDKTNALPADVFTPCPRVSAYRTYNQAFNAGRVNADYEWRNPDNDHRGRMHIIDYDKDEDDFRCSVYSQEIWIDGRCEEARGRACQQPDGSWAMIV